MAELVTFGEAMLRYSPHDSSRLEVADTFDVSVAGAESNVGVAATRAGADATWISKLPTNPLGRRVRNALHEVGLSTDIVWTSTGRVGTYYVEPGQEPRRTTVQYDRANAAITSAHIEELPTELITGADVFATSGITPALSSTVRETTAELLRLATTAGTTTVLDLNYRSKLWPPAEARETIGSILSHVDIMFVGEESAERVFQQTGRPGDVAASLADTWDLDIVVVTRGSWGSIAYVNGDVIEQRAFPTETVDPIGTGDAFVGGFLARYLEDASVQECLTFGTATAALKRTIQGDVAVVTRDEIERVIEHGQGGIDR